MITLVNKTPANVPDTTIPLAKIAVECSFTQSQGGVRAKEVYRLLDANEKAISVPYRAKGELSAEQRAEMEKRVKAACDQTVADYLAEQFFPTAFGFSKA